MSTDEHFTMSVKPGATPIANTHRISALGWRIDSQRSIENLNVSTEGTGLPPARGASGGRGGYARCELDGQFPTCAVGSPKVLVGFGSVGKAHAGRVPLDD